MFKLKCDLCGNDDRNLNTLFLYREKVDFCNNVKCKKKAYELEKQFRREVNYENKMFDYALRHKEKKLLKNIKK